MLRFKDCPRCKGDVLLDKDQHGWYEQCLQCGYLRNLETVVEVYQTASDVVKAALPGVRPEEVDISSAGDTLTIKGEHKEEQEVRDKDYLRKERRYGAFSRSVALPSSLKIDKAEATFKNGVLTLTIQQGRGGKAQAGRGEAQGHD